MISFDSRLNILTLGQRDNLLAEVDLLLTSVFETTPEKNFDFILKNKVTLSCREIVESLVGQEVLKSGTWEKFTEPLQNFKKDLLDLSVAKLTLASEPSSVYLEELVGILRSKSKQFVIVDLIIAPEIWGGFNLVWQGKVFDNSVKNKFDSWKQNFLSKPLSL